MGSIITPTPTEDNVDSDDSDTFDPYAHSRNKIKTNRRFRFWHEKNRLKTEVLSENENNDAVCDDSDATLLIEHRPRVTTETGLGKSWSLLKSRISSYISSESATSSATTILTQSEG